MLDSVSFEIVILLSYMAIQKVSSQNVFVYNFKIEKDFDSIVKFWLQFLASISCAYGNDVWEREPIASQKQ